MFDALFNAIAALLAWFYELPVLGGSAGVAVILLTLTVMLLLTPLNVKATRSMMTMSALQPEMKRIQQEYAHDRQKMNEEMLAFYRDNKINPVGGCLPMLVQMPFMIVLYWVINGLTRRATEVTTAANGEVVEVGEFLPKYLDQMPGSQLYQDLVGETSVPFIGLDLARSAASALQDAFTTGIPYVFLIIGVAGTAFLQQKQMSMRNPNAEVPPQQKILLRIMPLFFAVISFNFAAGLVLYFLVSNLYRIFQNAAISMKLYGLKPLPALLGVGTASLPLGNAGKDDRTDKRAEPKGTGRGGSESDRSVGSKAKGGNRENGSEPGARAKGKASSAGKASSGKTQKDGANKPARPTSGRVTPPGQRPANAPPRRKKKKR